MAMLKVGTDPSALADVPLDPSSMSYGLQDISASDAGRVQDAGNTMYKNRTSQKRKLSLTWAFPTPEQASAILRMFNPEYFYVRYFDFLDGCDETREFYAGDRSAPVKRWLVGDRLCTSLSFDIVER